MATYRLRGPDGSSYDITAPDDATMDQIHEVARQHIGAAPSEPHAMTNREAGEQAAQGLGTGERALIGAGKAFTDIGRGVKERVLEAGQALGVPDADKALANLRKVIGEEREISAPIMETTAGKVGNVIGTAAAAAPAMLIPGVNTAVGATALGAGLGGLEPTTEGESRLANVGAGAVGGLVGQAAGSALSKGLESLVAKAAARQAARQSQNAVRDATVSAAQKAGYVIPPSQLGSSTGSFLEGVAGKLKTAQDASAKNQDVTRSLVRDAFGIPDDMKISEGLEQARKDAGQAYEDLRNFPQPFKATPEYQKAVGGLTDRSQALAQFPSLSKNEAIEGLQQELSVPEMSPDTAVALSKQLRYNGRLHSISTDPKVKDLGAAQLEAGKAVDQMIQDNLDASGVPHLGEDFRHARQTIAMTHDVEAALDSSGNSVDARKLARLMQKGKPLSGNLKTIADFGANFKTAAQMPETMGSRTPISPLDVAVGLGGLAKRSAAGLGMLARPAIRAGILTKTAQGMMTPSYDVSSLLRGLARAPAGEIGGTSGIGLGHEQGSQVLQSLGLAQPAGAQGK